MNSPPRLAIQPTLGGAEPAPNGSGRLFVSDLAEGDLVSGAFAVRERTRLSRRNGDDFVKLIVADRTGAVEAVAWDDVDECFDGSAPGSVVFIEGPFSVHPQYGAKMTIKSLRPARPDEYEKTDLVEGSPVPLERLETDLRDLLATIQNSHLTALLDRFFAPDTPAWERFRDAP